MSYDLCHTQKATKPFYIERISTNIFSLEELCFYLYENICLIDESIVNEKLCDWIRTELGMKRLARQMTEQMEKKQGVAYFVMPVFREAGYLTQQQMREIQEQIARLEVQPSDVRQKLRGDYLIKCGMYHNAMHEYRQILNRRSPGKLGAQFYAEIWNNLGCAYARMFLFRQAADCFLTAWNQIKTKELLRKYVSTLPLFMNEQEYLERIRQIGADMQLVTRIQEYNSRVSQNVELIRDPGPEEISDLEQIAAQLKEDYLRSSKC